jgi:hypothetical protein
MASISEAIVRGKVRLKISEFYDAIVTLSFRVVHRKSITTDYLPTLS